MQCAQVRQDLEKKELKDNADKRAEALEERRMAKRADELVSKPHKHKLMDVNMLAACEVVSWPATHPGSSKFGMAM